MSLPRASVLVVDDEPQVRAVLEALLGEAGFDVVAVASGPAALAASRVRRFDLALVDLHMPGMTGQETIGELRRQDADLVVLCISGAGTLDAAQDALRQGAWQYVEKPFDPDALLLLVERALDHRELAGAVNLYEASQALLSSLSTAELRGRVLEMARRVLHCCSAVLLLDRDVGDEPWEAHAGGELPDEARVAALRLRDELPGGHAQAAPLPGDQGPFGAYAAFPLVVRDRALGLLVGLRARGAATFTAIEQRIGGIFAAQAALALDNARIYATLEALAVIDELTGLHSRRYLFDTVRRGVGDAPGGTSFLMIDVDHFKVVNDTFGHAAGDRVLRRIADLLLGETRETDIVARIGGEEFAVLLPGTDEATATEVAERIRGAVSRSTVKPHVTVSVGVASVPVSLAGSDTEDALERAVQLMERADLALYRAKGAGRNRVCVWRARQRREAAPGGPGG